MNKIDSAGTLADVAREANVAVGTVSRVMNGYENVEESLRRRVILAGRKLGFVPKLRRRHVAIIDGRQSPGLPVGYVSVMTSLISKIALSRDIGVEVLDIEQIDEIGECHIDAAIGVVFDDRILELLEYPSLPVVTINHPMTDKGIHSVYTDHHWQGYAASKHLIERGHERIAFLAIEPDEWGARQRHTGYQKALEEAGIPYDETLVRYSIRDPAYDILGRWLRRDVTAILNFSEDSALETLHIISNVFGLRIGDEISTISLEDLPIYQFMTPPQTVIRQPMYKLAEAAVNTVLGTEPSKGSTTYVPPADPVDCCLESELIERDSVADLRRAEQEPGVPAEERS